MYTTDDHKEKIYEEIRELMKLCDSYENEVTAISNGTMYLVEDYCTAGTFDSEERLQNKLYINNIQIMASRIRIMADKINSTLIQPITDMTYDPSEQTQIFLEEILLRINELTHSIKTSYNNIRLLYQYMTGKAPESHSIECVIIPYLNFNSIIEEDDDNEEGDTEEYEESISTKLCKNKHNLGKFGSDSSLATIAKEIYKDDDAPSEYLNSVPMDARKTFEERLKKKTMEKDKSFGDIKDAVMEKVKSQNIDEIPEGTPLDNIIDKDTWSIAGFVSDEKYLPKGTEDFHDAWIVWPDFNKNDYPDEIDPNKYYFVHFSHNECKWMKAYRGENSFTQSEVNTYIIGVCESGCNGKVDNIYYLPDEFQKNGTLYCEFNGYYFRFIEGPDTNTSYWVNTAFDTIETSSLFTGNVTNADRLKAFPSNPKEGDIVNTLKASYVWLHNKWVVHSVQKG